MRRGNGDYCIIEMMSLFLFCPYLYCVENLITSSSSWECLKFSHQINFSHWNPSINSTLSHLLNKPIHDSSSVFLLIFACSVSLLSILKHIFSWSWRDFGFIDQREMFADNGVLFPHFQNFSQVQQLEEFCKTQQPCSSPTVLLPFISLFLVIALSG